MPIDLYETLNDQVALVTGANRGIGAEIAGQLADLGAAVYAGVRTPSDVTDDRVEPIRLDVTAATTVDDATETIAVRSGRLDVLVNNAAIYGPAGRLEGLDWTAIEETLLVNLLGPLLVTQRAFPLLASETGARIVNVSSGAGQFATGIDAGHLPYGVSKAGLNAFTVALAAQYPDMYVNAVCPGWVRTDMGGAGAPRSVADGADTPVWLARFREGESGCLWRDRQSIDW